MSLITELQRRNVIRVAVFYIVSAWLFLQVADLLFEVLMVPDWTLRFLFGVLALAFPFVLFFAWAYELTPEGIRRESDVDRTQSITGHTGRKLNIAVVIVLAASAGLYVLVPKEPVTEAPGEDVRNPEQTRPVEPSAGIETADEDQQRSIAVLPFVNLSADAEQEYFADGIAEEVLNLLARSEGLKVTSRSSSFSFKGQNADIPTVAEKLGVANVLEGSVRRAGNRVRITAQLIEVDSDTHLWSQTFDRELTDIFAVQDEIAGAIADALKLQLAPAGSLPSGTSDVEAYDLYLKGRHLFFLRGKENMQNAVAFFEQAVARDPDFEAAWAALAGAYFVISNIDRDIEGSEVRRAAERALSMNPENVDALAALGGHEMYHDKDAIAAEKTFRRAFEVDPDHSTNLLWYGILKLSVGHLERARDLFERAVIVDPLVGINHGYLGFARISLGDESGLEEIEQALQLGWLWGQWMIGQRHLEQGRVVEAREGYRRLMESTYPGNDMDLDALFAGLLDPVERDRSIQAIRNLDVETYPLSVWMTVGLGLSYGLIDLAVKNLALPQNFVSLILPPVNRDEVYQLPQYKALLRQRGLIDYWETFGWPSFCRPLEGDDFECRSPSGDAGP